MYQALQLRSAALLYKYAFPVYRSLYWRFKNRQDQFHLELIRQFIKPGATVIDIGANIGFYSKYFSEWVGTGGKIYAFEPDVTNFKHLAHELRHASNVECMQKAVASENGSLTLYASSLLNVDHRTYETTDFTHKYTVQKISIDELIGEKQVDLIKMDIQGFEMDALKGMRLTLERNEEIILFTELWPFGLKQAGSSAVEVFDFLKQLNFNIYKVSGKKIALLNRQAVLDMKVDFSSDTNILCSKHEITQP